MKKILKYIGDDYFANPLYEDEKGNKYVDISQPNDVRYPTDLHTVSPILEEPDQPVHFDEIEVTGWSDEKQFEREHAMDYVKLNAVQMRAEDYLRVRESTSKEYALDYLKRSYGRTNPVSFADDMQKYFDILPVKPKWCTQKYIDNIRKRLSA